MRSLTRFNHMITSLLESTFLDFRRIGFVRQIVQDGRDPVPDIVGRPVDIPSGIEFDRHRRKSILAGRGDKFDAFDAGNPLFDELGDACLHDIGGRAGIEGFNGHHGGVDVRVFAQGQPAEGDQTEDNQQQRDHGGKHRPLDGNIG
jgi:hypothetical protein